MKEHLVRHVSKHKIQVHTTKRNKQQQKQKIKSYSFPKRKQRETREKKVINQNKSQREKMKIDGYSKHTHSLTHIHRHLHTHPPTHPPTRFGGKDREGEFDMNTFYKTRDYNINRK